MRLSHKITPTVLCSCEGVLDHQSSSISLSLIGHNARHEIRDIITMEETRGRLLSNDPASSIGKHCLFVSNEAKKQFN